MLIGFLGARAWSSIGMMLFGINALRGISPKQWLKQRWWLLGTGWLLMYLLSWFWSADKAEWTAHIQVKMPFLLLPLAFGFLPAFSQRQLNAFTWMLVVAMTLGAGYSLSFLLRHPAEMIGGYGVSHILPTPAYNDHISFSTTVAVCIGWCVYQWPFWRRSKMAVLLYLLLAFLVVYLHVLAAVSGLIAFYILVLCGLAGLFLMRRWKQGLLAMLMLAGGAVLSLHFIPTLNHRIGYTVYSWDKYKAGERSGDYSMIGRIISYRIGARVIAAHPLTGVGAGDVLTAMDTGYNKWYPQVTNDERLWPHNQFLTVAAAAGIPAALFFTAWIIAPLLLVRRTRDGFFFVVIWLMLLVTLMIDPFLEVQFGVFVYLFFLLWQRQTLLYPPAADAGIAL